jgi:hypothetical protein
MTCFRSSDSVAHAREAALVNSATRPAHHHTENLTARVRDQLSPQLADGIARFRPDAGFQPRAVSAPRPGRSGAEPGIRARRDRGPPSEFRLLAAFAVSGGYTGRRFKNLRISPSAREDLLQRARARSEEAAALADMLLNDVAKFQAALLETLREFADTVFDAEWSTVARLLLSEVAEKQQLARRRGTAQALAEVGAGRRVLLDPPRIVLDHLPAVDPDGQPHGLSLAPRQVLVEQFPLRPRVVRLVATGSGFLQRPRRGGACAGRVGWFRSCVRR